MSSTHREANRRSPLLPPPQHMPSATLKKIVADHEKWLLSRRKRGSRAKLINVQLAGIDLSGRNLSRAHIELCDLRNANFIACQLGGAWLHSCELDQADFSNVIGPNCQFLSSYAPEARFLSADLQDACFMYAKLAAADFSGANLSRADFDEAEFPGAGFQGANIAGVNLARWHVKAEQLIGASMDGKTKLPLNISLSR